VCKADSSDGTRAQSPPQHRTPSGRAPLVVAYFRIRAVAAGVAAGIVAFAGLLVARNDARYLFDGLTSRALPLVVVSVGAGLGALVLLRANRIAGGRVAAVVAAGALVLGWGVAQWDHLLPESLTLTEDYGCACRDCSRRAFDRAGFVCCTSSTRRACSRRRAWTNCSSRRPGLPRPDGSLQLVRHHTLDRPL
jgi:hypothetical protein